MELRVLRYFQTVVTELNISRAAKQLHVSQPTISRQLRELEAELGVTLFDRGNRTIKLTTAGEYFSHRVNQILDLTDKTVENINETLTISGSVTIGAAEVRSFLNVAQAINTLQEQYPNITFNINSTYANDLHTHLKSGNYDFGIVMEPVDKSDYNFLRLPGESRWGLLVPNSSPLAKLDHLAFTDLKNQKLIVSHQHGVNNLLQDWFGASSPNFKTVATYNLLYNASLLVSAGVGYALCVDGIINTNQSDLTFVPLEPRLTVGTSLVWVKNQRLSPAANAFLKQLAANLNLPLPK